MREPADHAPEPRPLEWWAAGLTVAVFVGGVLVVRARSLLGYIGPALFGDEMGALFTARWITGTGVTPSMGGDSYYAPGFGLLLAPVELLTNTPVGTYRAALLINLLLAGLVLPMLYLLVRMTSPATNTQALVVAAGGWGSVSLLVNASLTWAETLAALVVVVSYVVFVAFDRRPSVPLAWLLAACCAANYLVHSRLVIVVVALCLGVLAAVACRRMTWRVAFAFAASLVILLVAVRVLVLEPHRSALWSSDRERSLLPSLEVLTSLDGIRTISTLIVGHLWYVLVSSLGLSVVGAWHLLRRVRAARGGHDPTPAHLSTPAAVVLLVGLLGMIAASVSFLAGPSIPRADMAFYGRYIAPVLQPVSVVGLAVIVTSELTRRNRIALLLVGGSLMVTLGAALGWLGAGLAEKPRNAFNAADVEMALREWGPSSYVTIALVASSVLLLLLFIRPRALAAVVVALLLLVPSVKLADWAEANNLNTSSVVPHRLVDEVGAEVIAFGPMSAPTPYRIQFHNPHVRVRRVELDALDGEPCVVVSRIDLSEELEERGYVVVVEEPRGRTQLWGLPSITSDESGRIDCRATGS